MPDVRERVLEAAGRWVWVPTDAVEVETPEYRLTRYPHRTSVQWSRTDRPVDDLVDEVLHQVRAWGRGRLRWWVSGRSRPAGTEHVLRRRGFELVEIVQVLAVDDLPGRLAGVVEDLGVPADVTTRTVDDAQSLRRAGELSAAAFGWDPPTEEQVAAMLATLEEERSTAQWSERQFLALVGGVAVGAAGCTVVGDVARLWGGGVLPEARGRGAYRALLAARLAAAAERGADLALVKGRTDTSGPILRRAGFTSYGAERCYELVVT